MFGLSSGSRGHAARVVSGRRPRRGGRRATTAAGLALILGGAATIHPVVPHSADALVTSVLGGRRLPAALPAGSITTYAGGLEDAHGTPISFGMTPASVALAGPDILLVADEQNCVVWLVNHSGQAIVRYGRSIAANQMAIVAGNASCSFDGDNGPADKASLDDPGGVAVDEAGNLYIADSDNNRVREVHATGGIITTVAGAGKKGFSGDGGPANKAALSFPTDVTVDGAGNLYIMDALNYRIREVHRGSAIITTVAGGGKGGFSGDGGPATKAALNSLSGVAVDRAGNLYIADSYNNRVREVHASSGIITTVAGTGKGVHSGDGGSATKAALFFPTDVVVDGTGNLYIADSYNNRVRKVHAGSGIITTVAGAGNGSFAGDGGPATKAAVAEPEGIAVDGSGNLYIADLANSRIREVQAAGGIITTVAGAGVPAAAGDGGLARKAAVLPYGLALDRVGNLYIADYYDNQVREVHAASGIITTVAGTGKSGFSGDGGPAVKAHLAYPEGMAVDGAGNLYIADSGNNRVREVHAGSGIITTVAGTGKTDFSGDGEPATKATLEVPYDIVVDGSGNLYIADSLNNRVREVHAGSGIITTVAGTGNTYFSGDGGLAIKAGLVPEGLALDAAGNLYIVDPANNQVREVHAAGGIITTVVGTGKKSFSGDGGPATLATLDEPEGIAVDSAGNLYIADSANDRVREVHTGSGIITTVAGSGKKGFSGDGGPAGKATLNEPDAIVVDKTGNLYIADSSNGRVRLVRGVAVPLH